MITAQFEEKVTDGVIHLPQELKGSFQGMVRIFLWKDEENNHEQDFLDELLEHPIELPGFRPLSREAAKERLGI